MTNSISTYSGGARVFASTSVYIYLFMLVEKGYCMRGDLCPYDHGTDPVVLEDVALSRVLTFGPHTAQTPGTVPVTTVPESTQGPNGNAPPPHLPLATLPPPHMRNHHSNMGMVST